MHVPKHVQYRRKLRTGNALPVNKTNEAINEETILNQATPHTGSAVLEIQRVPTELILFAITNWQLCQVYAKKTGKGKCTNNFIKAIAVWLILKNETTSGSIQHYRSQLPQLAQKCKMCVRTLESYLSLLRSEGLVSVVGKHLLLKDYRTLRKYEISTKQREETIYYDTSNKTTLAEQLIAIGLERMKDSWMQVYWQKVTKNQAAFSELKSHLIAWLDADQRRLEDDPEYFRDCHLELLKKTYKEEAPGQESFDFLHHFITANPDLNARQDTYALKFGLQAAMSFVHIKRKLQSKGLIHVRKDHVESEYRAHKDEQVFHHRYVRKTKQTIWFRPDQITIKHEAIFGKKIA